MLFLIRMKSGSMTVISRNNYYGITVYPLTSCKVRTVPWSFSVFTQAGHSTVQGLIFRDNDLVKKAKHTLGEYPYYPDEGDVVWCVFDCDDNTDAMLRNAGEMADKNGYRIAYSNPCFEYWYLLHFADHTGHLENCDAVIRQLRIKGRLPTYMKSDDLYPVLLPKQPDAVSRAEKRTMAVSNDYDTIPQSKTNPVTNVHELVSFLNEKRK